MNKINYESAGAEFKMSAAELRISFALDVGLLTTAHHQTILIRLPSLWHSSQVPQILAIELKKETYNLKLLISKK
jgi:hypothetical protein